MGCEGGREEERKKYPYTIKQDAKFSLLHINEDSWCLNSYCTILAWYLNNAYII
jgi:hypothetical protein